MPQEIHVGPDESPNAGQDILCARIAALEAEIAGCKNDMRALVEAGQGVLRDVSAGDATLTTSLTALRAQVERLSAA